MITTYVQTDFIHLLIFLHFLCFVFCIEESKSNDSHLRSYHISFKKERLEATKKQKCLKEWEKEWYQTSESCIWISFEPERICQVNCTKKMSQLCFLKHLVTSIERQKYDWHNQIDTGMVREVCLAVIHHSCSRRY